MKRRFFFGRMSSAATAVLAVTTVRGAEVQSSDVSSLTTGAGRTVLQDRSADEIIAVANYDALREYAGQSTRINVIGHVRNSGVAGDFLLDATDTSTPDDGGVNLRDGRKRLWRRVMNDAWVNVEWFGAVPDAVTYDNVKTDSSKAFQACIDYCLAHNKTPYFSGKFYAHDLMWGKPANFSRDDGGITEKGITLRGSGLAESVIYTNGNDFMGLPKDWAFFVGRDFYVVSKVIDKAPSGTFLKRDNAIGIEPNAVFCDLERVGWDRFDRGVWSPTGGYVSRIRYCKSYFCNIMAYLGKMYATNFDFNDVTARTVLKTDGPIAACSIKNNHVGLGVHTSIFGGAETTWDLKGGTFDFSDNYMENYGGDSLNPASVLFRIGLYGESDRAEFRSNHINLGNRSLILRRFYRADTTTNVPVRSNQRWTKNNWICSDLTQLWQMDPVALPAVKAFIYDEQYCTLLDSRVIPINNQRLVATQSKFTFIKGAEEPNPYPANFNYMKIVGDVNLARPDGKIQFHRGHYRLTISCTGASSCGKAVGLNMIVSGKTYNFPLVDSSSSPTNSKDIYTSHTVILGADVLGNFSFSFPIEYAIGEAFTITDLTIVLEPLTIYNGLVGT